MRPITHLFQESSQRPSSSVAIRFKMKSRWIDLSWQEYYLRVEQLSTALLKLNVKKQDRVAILSNTRWEWAALDIAIMSRGAITVPIYQSSVPEEIEAIVNDAQPVVLVLENEQQLRKWRKISERCPSVQKIILMDGEDSSAALSWMEFMDSGENSPPDAFRKALEQVALADVATIVYTSGTSGAPRGVVLTHEQIASEMEGIKRAFSLSHADVSLCFLPFAHVLGRLELWLNVSVGFTLCFAESIERLAKNLPEIKPTVLIGVPRIFEKVYVAILAKLEGHPLKKQLFSLVTRPFPGISGALLSWPQAVVAEKLIYTQIREALGGRLRFAVSGGAPLAQEIAQFFNKAGVLLLEGYGLTETTGAIFANTPEAYRFGTVGKALDDVQIRIAEDGEILIKSQKVMREYYRNSEATAAAFSDGFFRTGDIGELSRDGFLRITDRKKDLIKTSAGKYVAPQKLENLLKLNPLISHVLVHGDQKKYIVALVTLDPREVERLKGLGRGNSEQLEAEIRSIIKRVNTQLASYETIKNFAILPQDFSIESGELTPSLKVKRKFCDEKFRDVINSLY